MPAFRFPHRMRDISRMFPELAAADDILLGRWERLIELLERRDFDLERFLSTLSGAQVVFFHRATLTASDSALYPAPFVVSITRLAWGLVIAGSTDTTVQILVDGKIKDTITIPAGETSGAQTAQFSIPAGSIAIARIITPGAGATSLTVVGA